MKFIENLIPVAVILTCIGIGALVYKQYAPADASFSGSGLVNQRSCTSSSTAKLVGPSTSNGMGVALEANPNRAWARIQVPNYASSTYFLSFDEGVAAVVDKGVALNAGLGAIGSTQVGSSTESFIDFGRNTDFPYTGIVKAITTNATAGASSTLLVTECSFF